MITNFMFFTGDRLEKVVISLNNMKSILEKILIVTHQ